MTLPILTQPTAGIVPRSDNRANSAEVEQRNTCSDRTPATRHSKARHDSTGGAGRRGARHLGLASALLVVLGWAGPSSTNAQGIVLGGGGQTNQKTRWTVSVRPTSARPGETIEVVAGYESDDGWYIYAPDFEGTGVPTELSVDTENLTADGEPTFPTPKEKTVVVLDEETHRILPGSGDVVRKFVIADSVEPGELDFHALLTFTTCNDTTCLPPTRNKPFALSVKILGADAAPPADDATADAESAAGGSTDGGARSADDGPPLIPLPSPFGGDKDPLGALNAGADSSPGPHVQWNVSVLPSTVRAGGEATIRAEYELVPGWTLYAPLSKTSVPTRVRVDHAHVEALGDPKFPAPVRKTTLGESYDALTGSGIIRQTIRVDPGAPSGSLSLDVTIDYLTCSATACDIPESRPFPVKLTIVGGDARSAAPPGPPESSPPPDTGPPESGPPEEGAPGEESSPAPADAAPASAPQGGGGLDGLGTWAFLGLMVGGALFALAMPCTYPMIPITVSLFTKQAEARSGSVLPLALAYGLGIILSFNAIGLVISFGLLQASDVTEFAANPWLNLAFGVAFIVFALMLFGIFTPRVPTALSNLSAKASSAGGYGGVFSLGLLLVITSFTCTAPIMGSLLAYAAKDGSMGRVALGMTTFGATMAFPFVLLALFPGKIQSLPRSGEWMNTVKVFLAFIELAAALKFLSNTDLVLELGWLPRETFLVAWSALAGVAGLYLLGAIPFKSESQSIGGVRLLVGLVCVMAALHWFRGTSGDRLDFLTETIAPPYSAGEDIHGESVDGSAADGASKSGTKTLITHSLDRGVAVAKANDLPMLIDFTGPT